MKRSIWASILGCIVCLLIALPAFAQATKAKEQKAAAQEMETKPVCVGAWKEIEHPQHKGKKFCVKLGFKKAATCPQKEEDRVPEMYILSLDDQQYGEFSDPKKTLEFVNGLDLFTCPVTRIQRIARGSTAGKKAALKGGDPMAAVIHDPDCGGGWYEYP